MREFRPWLRLLQRHRRQLAAGLVLMASTLMAGLGLLALSGWFITATAITAMAWAAGVNASLNLYAPGGGIRFFALARTASRYFERLVNHDAVLRLLADIRVELFRKLLRAEAYSAKRLGSAAFLNRLVSDVDTLDNLYLRQIAPPLVALAGSLGAAGLIAVFAPALSLVVLAVLVPWLGVVTLGMAWWTRRHGAAEMEAAERLRSHALTELEGMAELSAAGRLAHDQYDLLAEEHAQRNRQMQQEASAITGQALNTLVIHLLVVALLLFASQAWQANQVSGAVMVLIPLVVMALSEGFLPLPKAFVRWGATEAAAGRLNAEGAAEPDLPEQLSEMSLPEHPTLTWSHIRVARGVPAVFDDFSLSVLPGERLVITGASGSGKSSLASFAARLTAPDGGQVLANGHDGAMFSLTEWRERISVLTQDAHLFNESIAANLRVGNTGASDGQLWRVLEAVDLAPLVASLDHGLTTSVGEGGGQLSGGEGRRLALARVLLRSAPVVILDEPFTGLDGATATRVWNGIQPWLNGCSVVLMLHDSMPFIEADRVIPLTAGGRM
ncbi:thiol reductant ABC exporter subunit CydC [Salicola sp. Rm-C-2C1-2]|uniref:thiol reductant ABC exporter subunit CydC n=1 Tax=Salicola sp. Rm-C-2C1-2 TaxID=3141321 RepID=UPI0032E48960